MMPIVGETWTLDRDGNSVEVEILIVTRATVKIRGDFGQGVGAITVGLARFMRDAQKSSG